MEWGRLAPGTVRLVARRRRFGGSSMKPVPGSDMVPASTATSPAAPVRSVIP